VDRVATKNVELTIKQIRKESPVLVNMEEMGDINIVGAMYSIETGNVDFIC
jgi:carbonic anhydrase